MEQNLQSLVSQIKAVDGSLKTEANKAINILLTLRNWLIGFYIFEYEQKGQDRAKYGDKILETIAENMDTDGLSLRNLKLFRQFYTAYPYLGNFIPESIKQQIILI
jgi:hypothetical protein